METLKARTQTLVFQMPCNPHSQHCPIASNGRLMVQSKKPCTCRGNGRMKRRLSTGQGGPSTGMQRRFASKMEMKVKMGPRGNTFLLLTNP